MGEAEPGPRGPAPTVSVVIPTLDEEEHVVPALRSARRAFGDDAELVVADGGSADRTRELARREADAVLQVEAGRGRQLDAGARAAGGAVLVFLHADTRPEPDSAGTVRRTLAEPGVVGGCFRFGVHPPAPPGSRWAVLETAVRLRTRLFRTATGDHVIFTTRRAYDRAGGFPDHPLFEDVAFVRRLRRLGRFQPVPVLARTSRRRWEREGYWTTVGRHCLLRGAFAAGVPPERLADWYGAPGG